jgi:hypothetical protein
VSLGARSFSLGPFDREARPAYPSWAAPSLSTVCLPSTAKAHCRGQAQQWGAALHTGFVLPQRPSKVAPELLARPRGRVQGRPFDAQIVQLPPTNFSAFCRLAAFAATYWHRCAIQTVAYDHMLVMHGSDDHGLLPAVCSLACKRCL